MEDQGHKSLRENLNDPNCKLKITCFCSFSLSLSFFSSKDNVSREDEHLKKGKCILNEGKDLIRTKCKWADFHDSSEIKMKIVCHFL